MRTPRSTRAGRGRTWETRAPAAGPEQGVAAMAAELDTIFLLARLGLTPENVLPLRDRLFMDPVKEHAFDRGVNFDTILQAGGLMLCDEQLRRHHGERKR